MLALICNRRYTMPRHSRGTRPQRLKGRIEYTEKLITQQSGATHDSLNYQPPSVLLNQPDIKYRRQQYCLQGGKSPKVFLVAGIIKQFTKFIPAFRHQYLLVSIQIIKYRGRRNSNHGCNYILLEKCMDNSQKNRKHTHYNYKASGKFWCHQCELVWPVQETLSRKYPVV